MRNQICKLAIASIAFAYSISAYSQEKKVSHYFAIQANPLLQQVLNFGNASQVNNPYLLKYYLNFNNLPFEITTGFGYENSSEKREDGLQTKLSDLSTRIGLAYRSYLGEKFEIGIGADFIYGKLSNKTFNISSIDFGGIGGGFDSTITKTNSTSNKLGGGIQFNLSYSITPNILIGTESTYYISAGTDKFNIETRRFFNDGFNPTQRTTTKDNTKTDISNTNLTLPVALFLIIKI